MKVLRALHVSELPREPSDLVMVFEASAGFKNNLLRTDIKNRKDAGALALTEWMVKHNIDMIYE